MELRNTKIYWSCYILRSCLVLLEKENQFLKFYNDAKSSSVLRYTCSQGCIKSFCPWEHPSLATSNLKCISWGCTTLFVSYIVCLPVPLVCLGTLFQVPAPCPSLWQAVQYNGQFLNTFSMHLLFCINFTFSLKVL